MLTAHRVASVPLHNIALETESIILLIGAQRLKCSYRPGPEAIFHALAGGIRGDLRQDLTQSASTTSVNVTVNCYSSYMRNFCEAFRFLKENATGSTFLLGTTGSLETEERQYGLISNLDVTIRFQTRATLTRSSYLSVEERPCPARRWMLKVLN